MPGGVPVPTNSYDFNVVNFDITPLVLKIIVGNGVINLDNAEPSKVHMFVSALNVDRPRISHCNL